MVFFYISNFILLCSLFFFLWKFALFPCWFYNRLLYFRGLDYRDLIIWHYAVSRSISYIPHHTMSSGYFFQNVLSYVLAAAAPTVSLILAHAISTLLSISILLSVLFISRVWSIRNRQFDIFRIFNNDLVYKTKIVEVFLHPNISPTIFWVGFLKIYSDKQI